MLSKRAAVWALAYHLALLFIVQFIEFTALAQMPTTDGVIQSGTGRELTSASGAIDAQTPSTPIRLYLDPDQGTSQSELVRRALASNADLAADRLEIDRARARLRQAGLRPNPTLDVELSTGRLTGSPGEGETSIGIALPLELGGKRGRRVEQALVELEAAEARFADRERQLTNTVLAAYLDALAALRELEIIEGLNALDMQTVRVVEVRITEGDTAPIDLNLLRVEVERLKARRSLAEGRIQAAIFRLKTIAGIPINESVRLRENLAKVALRPPPASLETATEIALRSRPDLRLAQLNEEVAQAGLRLAHAESRPDATISTRYTIERDINDLPPPLVPFPDRDRSLSFGISVGLPLFNRNHAKAEAAIAISQARNRREYLEQTIRAEVASSYARFQTAQKAVKTFEQGVLDRSNLNIKAIRAAYEIGAFRVTDLIAEQRRLLDSQRDFTEALLESFRALTDLHAAIGAPLTH
jgi:outer membrane protein, heavy metal efflux system